jgi:hypothetical protein
LTENNIEWSLALFAGECSLPEIESHTQQLKSGPISFFPVEKFFHYFLLVHHFNHLIRIIELLLLFVCAKSFGISDFPLLQYHCFIFNSVQIPLFQQTHRPRRHPRHPPHRHLPLSMLW